MTPLEHACQYRGRGWMPVPIPAGQKGPQHPGWQNLRPTPADLPALFRDAGNVGIILGEPSGWLVDVDLDCPEAVRLAPEILPPTPLRFGRASKPASHWLYVCEGADYIKAAEPRRPDGGAETLLELRATTRQQTVFPGSVHPSGEAVRWEEGAAASVVPARVEAWDLAGRVRRLGAACLLARAGWQDADAVAAVKLAGPPEKLPADKVGQQIREWCGWAQPVAPALPRVVRDAVRALELDAAVEQYNRDNPRQYPRSAGDCPACGHRGCFGTVPGSEPPRWSCFSTAHSGCGVEGESCWTGDALDLDAAAAGVTPIEWLREKGYMALRPPRQGAQVQSPIDEGRVSAGIAILEEAAAKLLAMAAEDDGADKKPSTGPRKMLFASLHTHSDALADAYARHRGRVEEILTQIGSIRGLSREAQNLRSQVSKAGKALVVAERRAHAAQEAQNRPGADGEILVRGDEVEVAERLIDVHLGEHAVFDRSAMHLFDPESGAWEALERHHLHRWAFCWAGAWVSTGAVDEFGQDKVRMLSMSHAFANGVAKNAESMRRNVGFFDARPKGCGFGNGFLRSDGAWLPNAPEHRLLESEVMPFEYRPIDDVDELEARCPAWMGFLRSVFRGDVDAGDKMRVIMEFVGACLLGEATRYQKALLLWGPTASNGKSTLLKLISALFPARARCSVPPHLMGERFENVPLASARMNIVNDMPDNDLLDTGALKAIISGDEMGFNPKNMQPFTASPRCGNLFAANTLPATRDRSRGLWRRFLVITFNRSFENDPERDLDILSRVQGERESIAAACLYYALGLSDGGYHEPASSKLAVAEWEMRANNVREFAAEFEPVPDRTWGVRNVILYEAYKVFCARAGTRPLGRNKFIDEMKALGWSREESDAARRWALRAIVGTDAERAIVEAERVAREGERMNRGAA